MANNNNAPSPPTRATFRPAATPPQPPEAHHGATNTQNYQRYVTHVKLEFNIPSSQNAFNLNKAHQQVLQLMKDKDPTHEIVPSKEGKDKFSDLAKFPSNETDYNAFFEHAIDKQPTEARKIIVKHSLITTLKFSDLKFQNGKLMDHMFKNKIWIKYNQSDTL